MRDTDDIKTYEEIRERFRPAEGQKQLFEYTVKGIKEKFFVYIIILKENSEGNHRIHESEKKKPEAIKAVIRITSVVYEGRTFYFPISIISPQYDLKNTLVNELLESLNGFRESIIDAPIDKPGIQHFIMLKISLLLDMPKICTLFLKGATKENSPNFSSYRFSEDEEINAKMVDTFTHNIGRFLKDPQVTAIMAEMGREKVMALEQWYDKLAEAKLKFITENFSPLGPEKSRTDLDRLKFWFFNRHDFRKAWEAIAPHRIFQQFWIWLFPIAVGLFFLGLTIPVPGGFKITCRSIYKLKAENIPPGIICNLMDLRNRIYYDQKQLVDALIKKIGEQNTEIYKPLILKRTNIQLDTKGTSFQKIMARFKGPFIFAPLFLSGILCILWFIFISGKKYRRLSFFFEMFIPRLFLGIIAGSSIIAFSKLVWGFSTEHCTPGQLLIFTGAIFGFIGLYLYSKLSDMGIGIRASIGRVWWVLIFSAFLASLPMSGFYLILASYMNIHIGLCSGLFWVAALLFAGFFLHLIWCEKGIAEPL